MKTRTVKARVKQIGSSKPRKRNQFGKMSGTSNPLRYSWIGLKESKIISSITS